MFFLCPQVLPSTSMPSGETVNKAKAKAVGKSSRVIPTPTTDVVS
jgi:hypothetical protein